MIDLTKLVTIDDIEKYRTDEKTIVELSDKIVDEIIEQTPQNTKSIHVSADVCSILHMSGKLHYIVNETDTWNEDEVGEQKATTWSGVLDTAEGAVDVIIDLKSTGVKFA